MPYIKPELREEIDPHISALVETLGDEGSLNYALTRIVAKYLVAQGVRYDSINTVSGVLQKVAAEFDARVTRPYEELKIFQNGDIPEFSKIETLIREQQRSLPANIAPDADQLAHG
jgi:hypothetical protein